jgi:hypothetical protein
MRDRFDPRERKKRLLEPSGFARLLKEPVDAIAELNGLTGWSDSMLTTAIYCILVGLDEPAAELLERTHEWLQTAVERGEKPQRYDPHGAEALRYGNLALCIWLLSNRADDESYSRLVEEDDAYLEGDAEWERGEIDLTLADYVDAEAYQRALEIFNRTPNLRPPARLDAIKLEAQLAYVVSRRRLGLEYGEDEVGLASKRFLDVRIDYWLAHGHSIRAARWMKIMHWNGVAEPQRPSAKETVLRCYDYLPGRRPPGDERERKPWWRR